MVLVYGKETKNAMSLTKLDKVYEAEIILGKSSSTGDPEGEITTYEIKNPPTQTDIEQILTKFTGKITQTPPIFSAIKIDGQRAYNLARKGEKVEIPSREVEIFSLELLEYSFPRIKVRTHVSSGTYIRSLAEDIGESLGTKAYCNQLRRLEIADFKIENALNLEDFGILD
jgi:tRNA pseudouridine55 synthase